MNKCCVSLSDKLKQLWYHIQVILCSLICLFYVSLYGSKYVDPLSICCFCSDSKVSSCLCALGSYKML